MLKVGSLVRTSEFGLSQGLPDQYGIITNKHEHYEYFWEVLWFNGVRIYNGASTYEVIV